MEEETKAQIKRIGGLSGIAFAAVLIITGFSNRSERVASEPEGFNTYEDAVFEFDAKVALLQRRFDAEPMQIDWEHIEALEQKKRIRVPEKKPVEAMVSNDAPPDDLPEALPPEPPPEPMLLNGIAWSEQDPLAFVNDQVLRLGNHFNSFTVTTIEANSIILTDRKGNQTQLNLYDRLR